MTHCLRHPAWLPLASVLLLAIGPVVPGLAEDNAPTTTSDAAATQPAEDQETEAPAEDDLAAARAALEAMDRGTALAWRSIWRRHASCSRAFEDGYTAARGYQRAYESSLGVSRAKAVDELRVDVTIQEAGFRRVRSFDAPDAEVDAMHKTIPSLAPGEYGWVESVVVREVLGPEEMIVRSIRLIDNDAMRELEEIALQQTDEIEDGDARRFARDLVRRHFSQRRELIERQREAGYRAEARVVGFSAAGLPEGERYFGPRGEGLHLLVADVEDLDPQTEKLEPRRVIWSVDAYRRSPPLREEQFADLLRLRGMTPAEFVEYARDVRRRTPSEADERVFDLLLPDVPEG